MISHVSLEVSAIEQSAAFYDALLGPLGWRRVVKGEGSIGYGLFDDPALIVFAGRPRADRERGPRICFAAASIPAVKAAWQAGLDAGGRGEAAPGPRQHYRPGYYSAQLLDPDGYRLEVAVRAE